MGRRQRRKDARLTTMMPVMDLKFNKDSQGAYRRDLRAQAVRAQDRLPLMESWSWVETGPAGIDNARRRLSRLAGATPEAIDVTIANFRRVLADRALI